MNLPDSPRCIPIEAYNYELPDGQVAKYPLEQRDASRLLVYRQGQISETVYGRLPGQLPPGALLVFNNSRVVEARLIFTKPSGGHIEIFALEPHEQYADITTAMNQKGCILYKCLVGGASKWKHGMTLEKKMPYNGEPFRLSASIAERRPDCFVVQLGWSPEGLSFAEVLHLAGNIPIPPYLHRNAEAADAERYQTIYASADGSVAAPTAGLHFTPALMQRLGQRGFGKAFSTLHVGAGTFMPVKSNTMQGHDMHAEFIEVDGPLLDALLANETVVPVGTTAMRTLESLYWMGVKALRRPDVSLAGLEMAQWEVYDDLLPYRAPRAEALAALKNWVQHRGEGRLIVRTRILIAPGYPFGICNGLVTNFHQPKSTLLLLVAALIGDDWKRVYQYALEKGFRFLSYGDGCLLMR